MMTRERWQRIDQLFHAVLERDPSEQEAFLDEACDGDGDLRHEVATLLAAEAEADTVKLKLPAEVAAEMVAEDQTRPIIGQRIGRYKILSLLGAGGMGDVYLAEDKRLGRKVALKLLKESFIQDAERVRRFEQEARAASALNHPNILTIHEISEADELQFIATEFVEGQTLRQRLSGARMTLQEAIGVATQVANALNAAHSARIIHRDIKPENIMLRPDGLVKVLDFGLAKLTARSTEVDSEAITAAKNLTVPGMVMGTARYMSPEQARGLEVDERTDIFSTGVVIYEMMTGRAPFSGDTPSDVMAAILHHEPVPLTEFAPDAPIELESIVRKALCKDRDERYQIIKDLQVDLNSLMQEPLSREKQTESPKVSVREISDGGGHLITSPKSKAPEVIQESAPATSRSEEVPAQTVVSAEGRQSRIGRQKRRLMAAIVALIVVGAGSVYIATLVRQRYQSNQSALRPLLRLTFGSGLEGEPTWAPDARFIAYSSNSSGNFEIWVKSVGGGNPRPITDDPASDWQPDWSPDSSQIVFRSERGGGGLFVIPALGGVSRKISSFGYRPSWSPDGKQILFYSSMLRSMLESPRMYVVTLDGNPPREVLTEFMDSQHHPPLRGVAWHPDSQRVSLLWVNPESEWNFWTAPLEVGKAIKSEIKPEVKSKLKDAALVFDRWPRVSFDNCLWAHSGRAVYFEAVSQGVRNLWRVTVDPQTLDWITGPERLTTGPGLDTDIALSGDGKKLAYTMRTENTRLWFLPFDAATRKLKGEGWPVTDAGTNVLFPGLSRDGKKVIYNANQTGRREIREKSLEDGHETLLFGADEFFRGFASWSRDGTRLAYIRSLVKAVDPLSNRSIVILPAGGGDEQILTSPGAQVGPAAWSADGKWLLGTVSRGTPPRSLICLVPVAAAPHAETQLREIASDPEYNLYPHGFSPDDRWIAFNAIRIAKSDSQFLGNLSTLYIVQKSGGEWIRLTEGQYWDDKPHWSPDGRTIYFISDRTGFFNVWAIRFDPKISKTLGAPFQVTTFDSPSKMIFPFPGPMSLMLARDRLVLQIMEVSGSIWALDNMDR